jgi:hypothetical protein
MLGPQAYRNFDGMCWPAPGERLAEVANSLAHAVAFAEMRRDLLVAASVIEAYRELILLPATKRNAIIRELRKGPNAALRGDSGLIAGVPLESTVMQQEVGK